MLYVVAKPPC